ncbi:hypothetical protein A4S05_26215 [Nostoc sp. KVJ20]|nr:hypothetical protein A4S05_26215 [Nostoc sp. KVJ20]
MPTVAILLRLRIIPRGVQPCYIQTRTAIYKTSCKSAFCKRGKRVKVKGEGGNTELFTLPPFPRPLSPEGAPPSPFPDLCKKSTVPYKLGIESPKTGINVKAKGKHDDKNL